MASKRKDLSLREQVDAIREVEAGSSLRKVAVKFGVSHQQISRALKRKEEVLDSYHLNSNPDRKRARQGHAPLLEERLMAWFREMRAKKAEISGPLLLEKARALSDEIGVGMQFSDSWITRFKERNHLKFATLHGEAGGADTASANHWIKEVLPTILAEYEPHNVFNLDETGLVYRATPEGTFVCAEEDHHGRKKSKERITIGLVVSMAGEKLRPLVIGKSAKPRCFRSENILSLPLFYEANGRAWMTGEIYARWLRRIDNLMKLKNRKIVLFVDQCPAHVNVDHLDNVKVILLPPNTTSLIQPLDAGIILSFKRSYRTLVMKIILERLEAKVNEDASDAAKSISLLDGLHMIRKAWDNVSQETVKNCFKKCGFTKETVELVGSVEEDVEVDVEISEELDDIHAPLLPGDQKEEEEERLETSQEQVIDSKTAFHYLDEVKKFFEDKGLDTQSLKGCMDQVLRISKKKQTVMTDYFSTSF